MLPTAQSGKATVMVVDSQEGSRAQLQRLFESEGHAVRTAADGPEGLRAFFSWRPDLVLLDTQLIGMTAWQLLQRIREVSDTPVIMLTLPNNEEEKVRGLRTGADDMLVKPVAERELIARAEAVLRRRVKPAQTAERYQDRALALDFQRHQVHVRGRQVELSPLEFRLLTALVRNAGVVLSPDQLLDLCWGGKEASPANVRVYVGYLRRKIEEDRARPRLIENVREFGYRYRPPPADA
jgi:DNA-binding response OmpR family regulator